MTYCLALRLDEGLVFLTDTRTNAGVDNVGTYRKLHVFEPAADRLFAIESAGSLATTQEVLDRVRGDLAAADGRESLATVEHLFEAALYLGRLSQMVASSHQGPLKEVGADGTATFILGGHVGSGAPDILLVYPEGNYIRASDERPFLQIGETKYGKYLLEMAVEARVDLGTAMKIALGSMMSTARANLAVGPPYDLGVYRNSTRQLNEFRVEKDSEVLADLGRMWEHHIMSAIADLPFVSEPELDAVLNGTAGD